MPDQPLLPRNVRHGSAGLSPRPPVVVRGLLGESGFLVDSLSAVSSVIGN